MTEKERRPWTHGAADDVLFSAVIGVVILVVVVVCLLWSAPMVLMLIESHARPTATVDELLEASGDAVLAIWGLSLASASLITVIGCLKDDPFFSLVDEAWVRSRHWSALTVAVFAAAMSQVPFLAILIACAAGYGPGADDTVVVSRYWIDATIANCVLWALLSAGLAICGSYSRVHIRREDHEVSWQVKRWPFRARTGIAGKAIALEVFAKEALEGQTFLDRESDEGWLILRTTGRLVPIRRLLSNGQMRNFNRVALLWNEKMRLPGHAPTASYAISETDDLKVNQPSEA